MAQVYYVAFCALMQIFFKTFMWTVGCTCKVARRNGWVFTVLQLIGWVLFHWFEPDLITGRRRERTARPVRPVKKNSTIVSLSSCMNLVICF